MSESAAGRGGVGSRHAGQNMDRVQLWQACGWGAGLSRGAAPVWPAHGCRGVQPDRIRQFREAAARRRPVSGATATASWANSSRGMSELVSP